MMPRTRKITLLDGTDFTFIGGKKYQMKIKYTDKDGSVETCEPMLCTWPGNPIVFFTEKCKGGQADIISVLYELET